MDVFQWNETKNQRLKKLRGISFEEIVESKFVAVKQHPTREGQQIILFEYQNYIWVAPCVMNDKGIFLKTLYRSRKHTEIYRRRKHETAE